MHILAVLRAVSHIIRDVERCDSFQQAVQSRERRWPSAPVSDVKASESTSFKGVFPHAQRESSVRVDSIDLAEVLSADQTDCGRQ